MKILVAKAQGSSYDTIEKECLMQGFGVVLFMWGALDYFMSTQEVDVYYDWFGIYLPDAIYNYSHWVAMALGSVVFAAGKQNK